MWQTTTKEYIFSFALSLNKKSSSEIYAIIIRNSESWNSIQMERNEIYEDHKADAISSCNWITEWNRRIDNLKIKEDLYTLNQDKYLCIQNNSNESLKKTYEEEAKKSLDERTELLDTIHQEIKAQKVNSQYQSQPYQSNSWIFRYSLAVANIVYSNPQDPIQG